MIMYLVVLILGREERMGGIECEDRIIGGVDLYTTSLEEKGQDPQAFVSLAHHVVTCQKVFVA
jgi:hypothetical protein